MLDLFVYSLWISYPFVILSRILSCTFVMLYLDNGIAAVLDWGPYRVNLSIGHKLPFIDLLYSIKSVIYFQLLAILWWHLPYLPLDGKTNRYFSCKFLNRFQLLYLEFSHNDRISRCLKQSVLSCFTDTLPSFFASLPPFSFSTAIIRRNNVYYCLSY